MGDLLLVRTRITRPQALFIGEFDYGNYLRLQHKVGVGYVRPGQWQIIGHVPIRGSRAYATTVQRKLAQRYSDAGLHGQPLALISAITLGERDALDSDLRQSFAAAGAAHLLRIVATVIRTTYPARITLLLHYCSYVGLRVHNRSVSIRHARSTNADDYSSRLDMQAAKPFLQHAGCRSMYLPLD